MIVLTGATGFLGKAVCDALLHQERPPLKALCRSPHPPLADRGVTVVAGSLHDAAWVASQIAPGDVVVHMAGKVEFAASGVREMHDLHVEATRTVARAACAAGARLILVSSSGTTAVSRHERLIDESAAYPMDLVSRWPYYLTKTLQERLVLDMAARDGLDAVVLNPSLLLGPGDDRNSSTQVVRDFLDRRLPTVPPGGISVVDVRDAAAAVCAAIAAGRRGERYFLAGHNCRFDTFFRVLETASGVRAPALRLPGRLATAGAFVAHKIAGSGHKLAHRLAQDLGAADLPHPALIEMANHFWYADSQKAARELSFRPRPLEATVRDTISYLRGPQPARHGLVTA